MFKINESRTKGHNFNFYKPLVQSTIRKDFFSIKVVNNWNSLMDEVAYAVFLESFKSKFDNTWEDEIYMCLN